MKEKFVSKLHSSTKRNYLERMKMIKFCMKIAKNLDKNIGMVKESMDMVDRYIKNRWEPVALNLIKLIN